LGHNTILGGLSMEKITINLAGTFEGKSLHEEISFEFKDAPLITDIFAKLNKNYKILAFSVPAMKKNQIAVLLNGVRLIPTQSKEVVKSNDLITIVQPLIGG
jgi:sulfur carrier protein ThiS